MRSTQYIQKAVGVIAGAGAAFALAIPAFAQTTTNSLYNYGTSTAGKMSTSTMGTTTPGVPSTGVGGDMATTLIILAAAALIAIAGAVYLRQRPEKDEVR